MWKRWTRHWKLNSRTHTKAAPKATRISSDHEEEKKEGQLCGESKEVCQQPRPNKKHRMTKKSSPTKTHTGNALAQFVILSALTVVAYQFLVTRLYSSANTGSHDGVTPLELSKSTPASSSPWTDAAVDKHRAKYRNDDREVVSTTEFSCFMACVGLFGLMQRKHKKRSEQEEDEQRAVEAQTRRSVEKQVMKKRSATALVKRSSSCSSTDDVVDTCVVLTNKSLPARDLLKALSSDVQVELLTFLSAEDLVACTMVNKSWLAAVGDQSHTLWQQVFCRDFGENGRRFEGVVPFICWRQYYFMHHFSRAVEMARYLDSAEQRKCVVIEGFVYDVTSFLDSHPGGYHVIGDVLGTDASDLWDQFQHSAEAKELMKEFIVRDAVLEAMLTPQTSKFLRRNLAIVETRWKKISWWLAHAHLCGALSHSFLELGFKLTVWRTTKRPVSHQ